MNIPLVGNESGLLSLYNFEEGTACGDNSGISTITDLAGGDNNGVLNNFDLDGSNDHLVYMLVQVQVFEHIVHLLVIHLGR